MPDKKAYAKWVPALFALAAVLNGAAVILGAVLGRDFNPFTAVAAVMLAVVAIGFWRKRPDSDKAK